MSDRRYTLISTKIDADISQFMKLMKKRYGVRTESEALRIFIREHDDNALNMAQQIAEMHQQVLDETDDTQDKQGA